MTALRRAVHGFIEQTVDDGIMVTHLSQTLHSYVTYVIHIGKVDSIQRHSRRAVPSCEDILKQICQDHYEPYSRPLHADTEASRTSYSDQTLWIPCMYRPSRISVFLKQLLRVSCPPVPSEHSSVCDAKKANSRA